MDKLHQKSAIIHKHHSKESYKSPHEHNDLYAQTIKDFFFKSQSHVLNIRVQRVKTFLIDNHDIE